MRIKKEDEDENGEGKVYFYLILASDSVVSVLMVSLLRLVQV